MSTAPYRRSRSAAFGWWGSKDGDTALPRRVHINTGDPRAIAWQMAAEARNEVTFAPSLAARYRSKARPGHANASRKVERNAEIAFRVGAGETLRAVGGHFGLSPGRIRQIYANEMARLGAAA